MPELPEVTTIVNDINERLVGRRINEAKLTSLGENLRIKSKQDLDQMLTGKKIEKATRRAKYLIIELSNGNSLVIHLKLTGQFILRDKTAQADEFTRLILNLDEGRQIRLCDRNGAAEAFIVSNFSEIEKNLGSEPFEIKAEDFYKEVINSDKKTIKETIVNQKIIAGVGNIYADEALFAVGMNPFNSPKTITKEEVEKLLEAIKQVLQSSISHRGTTIDSYRDLLGNPGENQNYLQVYGKRGKPCPICKTPIEYTEIASRRTHYCKICQAEAQLSLF